MNTPRQLLVATDFSAAGQAAVDRACLLAKDSGARITVMHVISPQRLAELADVLREDMAQTRTQAEASAAAKLHAQVTRMLAEQDVHAASMFDTGAVVNTLTIAADTGNHDLIIVGARGENPVRGFLLGSNAERVLRKSGRATLVVRRPPAGSYRQVLVPVDFSDYSRDALRLACDLAPDAVVTVLNVFAAPLEAKLEFAGVPVSDINAYRERGRRQAEAELHDFLSTLPAALRKRLVPDVEVGYPPEVILDKATALGADLIALGKHGRSPVEEWMLGSVTLHVLQNASADVLAAAHPTAR